MYLPGLTPGRAILGYLVAVQVVVPPQKVGPLPGMTGGRAGTLELASGVLLEVVTTWGALLEAVAAGRAAVVVAVVLAGAAVVVGLGSVVVVVLGVAVCVATT